MKVPFVITALVLAVVFFILGGVFVALPGPAASFYGLPTDNHSAEFYVRAIGLRDMALSIYIAGLTIAGERRALSIVLLGTLIIPAGDLLLLLLGSDAARLIHYALHFVSLLCFAGLAWWNHQTLEAG